MIYFSFSCRRHTRRNSDECTTVAGFVQGLQEELVGLRDDQNRIEIPNNLHAKNVEEQVTNLKMDHQNNLPGLLPTIALTSLLKNFTGDDVSETWQDWLDNFTLAARQGGWAPLVLTATGGSGPVRVRGHVKLSV